MTNRTCSVCGARFRPNVHNQINCSRACTKRKANEKYEPTRAARKREERRGAYAANPEHFKRKVARRYRKLVYGDETITVTPNDRYAAARKLGYRSGLEVRVSRQLTEAQIEFRYEPGRIPFTQPQKQRYSTPDFVLPNGIVVETKGRFVTADRQKHIMIKASNPDLDIRFAFSNPNTRISKTSNTRYRDWADYKGFPWCGADIPEEWLREPTNQPSLAILQELGLL